MLRRIRDECTKRFVEARLVGVKLLMPSGTNSLSQPADNCPTIHRLDSAKPVFFSRRQFTGVSHLNKSGGAYHVDHW